MDNICFYCGENAKYQLKNGKWCCENNARKCKAIKEKIRLKISKKWQKLKECGINKLKDIPIEIRKKSDIGLSEVCFYCGAAAKYKLKNGKWCCCKSPNSCPSNIKKNRLSNIGKHNNSGLIIYNEQVKSGEKNTWNKGLNKNNDERIRVQSEKLKEKYKSGELKPTCHKHSEQTKQKISISLKKAHEELRHRGWSFKNLDVNHRSYPEKFFIRMLYEFDIIDNYLIKEKMPFGKYFFDFAFVNEKIDVEIDGSQHYRTQEAIEHDKVRDLYTIEHGWKVYRIKWIDLMKNTFIEMEKLKKYIEENCNN